MEYIDKFRDPELVRGLLKRITAKVDSRVRIMEVCGTHTRAILKSGIKNLLSDNIELISGPGCPICVTSSGYIDAAVKLASKEEVIVATFGDMMRVPGNEISLHQAKASGCDIRVVYSPLDTVELAQQNPDSEVVFLALGFETTAPTIALNINQAAKLELQNYSILSSLKTMPGVMEKLAASDELNLDGFICPGHVSTIIGAEPFEFLAYQYNLPAVIAGFEPGDILLGLYQLLEMEAAGISRLKNQYSRVVKYRGNRQAIDRIYNIFTRTDAFWRGMGSIEDSGLRLKDEYRQFSARDKFGIQISNRKKPEGCICGEILRGIKKPVDCELFADSCTPESPIGPCMVSSEGACAAYYQYQ
ncbi:hydrogenase formation protein HypD [Acetohalobium arabaticum]|uniref:Hydrogenase expression/formation protein HypD n=1 Tax=Acetohalobium arabaticum (strain ATCC 49924 / DSM 5501 / Z-7288) TaxID=574087 RepID=D9QVE6_ACEAZ|nr:hydrogenase formation protein HypD [Acetohalobium arabaticum]ADL12205.1 hydrogenase expression/formation protein HypD [Acetohalobium arabaticum DSM 5501]